jgi:hypothetical protein
VKTHAARRALADLLRHYVTLAEQGDAAALAWFLTDDADAVCDALDLVLSDVLEHVAREATAAVAHAETLRALEIDAEAHELWLARKHPEHSERELAERLGVCQRTVQNRMRKAGIAPRPRGRPRLERQEAA